MTFGFVLAQSQVGLNLRLRQSLATSQKSTPRAATPLLSTLQRFYFGWVFYNDAAPLALESDATRVGNLGAFIGIV